MRQTPFLNRTKLELLVKSFASFLGIIAALMAVHYPVLPENVLALYNVDRSEALNLGEFLSVLAFAAAVIAVVRRWRSESHETNPIRATNPEQLLRVGLFLLLFAGSSCLAHFNLTRISVRVAFAISEA